MREIMANPRFTRRGLLRVSILGAAAGAAGVLLSACGGAPATPTPAPAPRPPPPAPAPAPTNPPPPAAAAPAAAPTATTAPAAAAPAASTYPTEIEIGINLPFTGADAADAANIRDGAL